MIELLESSVVEEITEPEVIEPEYRKVETESDSEKREIKRKLKEIASKYTAKDTIFNALNLDNFHIYLEGSKVEKTAFMNIISRRIGIAMNNLTDMNKYMTQYSKFLTPDLRAGIYTARDELCDCISKQKRKQKMLEERMKEEKKADSIFRRTKRFFGKVFFG